MKYQVRFDFPITIGNASLPSDAVFVDFPTLPRIGDHINPEDENFAPLYRTTRQYFDSTEAIIDMNIALNVVKYVSYCNGEPIIVVGNDPDKLLLVRSPDEGGIVLSSTKCPPRVGDMVCGEGWYVHSVDISNSETVQGAPQQGPCGGRWGINTLHFKMNISY